jgi:aryl-alcohol dehydrogenase-like predicted oxidoreductase
MTISRKIGTTNIEVQAIGLGAMPLSLSTRPSESDAIKVIHATLDLGTNFIDTADAYCIDDSETGYDERLIAKALKLYHAKTDEVIVATKGACIRPNGEWQVDASPKHLREACEFSLKNLNTSVITLYQLHAPDPNVPFEDSVGELSKLKEEGKILHVGLSNISTTQLEQAQKIVRIESVQNRCNAFVQNDFHNGMIELCKKQKVTYIPYSPVGGFQRHLEVPNEPVLSKLAQKYSVSPHCILLNWLLSHGEHILPIPGSKRIETAIDSPKALTFSLSKNDLELVSTLGTI